MTFTTKRVSSQTGISISAEESTVIAKERVLWLPGLLCDEAIFASQTYALADVADSTVASFRDQDTIAQMADVALGIVDGEFSLVGHSMGGYVALEVMRRAPERVRRLALLSTQPRADTDEQEERRIGLIQRTLDDGFTNVIESFLPLAYAEDRLDDGHLMDGFRSMANRVGVEVFLRQQRAIMGRIDSSKTLSEIQCPTLVLCGRQDQVTPLANSEDMARTIANATLSVLGNCGHMAPVEHPDAVGFALRAWLAMPTRTIGDQI